MRTFTQRGADRQTHEIAQVRQAATDADAAAAEAEALAAQAGVDLATLQASLATLVGSVSTLSGIVAGKASQSVVDALAVTVASKASQSALDALAVTVAGKASQGAVDALSAALASLSAMVPLYVSADRISTAEVYANFPPQASRRGMLAKVYDLYGAIDGVLRCGYDGTRYFWQPNGVLEFASPMAMTGNVTLTALGSPTIIPFTGSILLGVTRNVTLSTANAHPGARKRISTRGMTSLLGTLNILSGVSTIVSLLANNDADFALDYSSGSAQWIRI